MITMMNFLKIIGLFSILNVNVHSQALVGGARDDHSCLIGAGYTWCESSNSCIRQWETPCEDYYSSCDDCLNKQMKGMNIACPQDCDMIAVDPMPPMIIDPLPPPSPPIACSEVMCMMYCENGNRLDENGCPMCVCNDQYPLPVPQPVPQIPGPVPQPVPISEPDSACPITQPPCSNYLCPRIEEVTSCGQGGLDSHTTYRLSVILKDNMNIKNIYALYGNSLNDNEFLVPASYQSAISINNNMGGISPSIIGTFPDSEWDSWLTIGITDGDKNSALSSVGVPFGSWTEDSSMTITNGAVFILDPEFDSPILEEIVISQITIPNNQDADFVVSIQGKTIDTDTDKSWTESNVRFHLPSMVNTNPLTNCVSYYDGCNTCRVDRGVIGGCTRLMCFREDSPRCLQYDTDSDISISGH